MKRTIKQILITLFTVFFAVVFCIGIIIGKHEKETEAKYLNYGMAKTAEGWVGRFEEQFILLDYQGNLYTASIEKDGGIKKDKFLKNNVNDIAQVTKEGIAIVSKGKVYYIDLEK